MFRYIDSQVIAPLFCQRLSQLPPAGADGAGRFPAEKPFLKQYPVVCIALLLGQGNLPESVEIILRANTFRFPKQPGRYWRRGNDAASAY